MMLNFNKFKDKELTKGDIILAGDVGATKTILGLFKKEGANPISLQETRYISHDYKNILELIYMFIKNSAIPDVICLGVAGPVLYGRAALSNIGWEIDSNEISNHFKVKIVHLINDLEATAYGISVLHENDFSLVHAGNEPASGNVAVIAPGTGLGEAGIYWDGEYHYPFATEGGHCDFSPRSDFDFNLYKYLQKKYGHVSWERLLCGPGIINIYDFLRNEIKMEEPGWLIEKYNGNDKAVVISQNTGQSEICEETMQCFIRYLAYECANLVLKLKATGGLFIGGGIAPNITSRFADNLFNVSFSQSGRLSYLLETVPVKIIMNTKTALYGAAYYGAKFLL